MADSGYDQIKKKYEKFVRTPEMLSECVLNRSRIPVDVLKNNVLRHSQKCYGLKKYVDGSDGDAL